MQSTNNKVASGIIQSVDHRGYGFIDTGNGKNLYFQLSDGLVVKTTSDHRIEFTKTQENRVPKIGDKVVYVQKKGWGNNQKAYPWGFDPKS